MTEAILGLQSAVTELLGQKSGTKLGYNGAKVGHFYAAGGHAGLLEDWLSQYEPEFSADRDPDYLYIKLIIAFGQVELLKWFVTQYSYDLHWQENGFADTSASNLCTLAVKADQVEMLEYLIGIG